MANNAVFAIMTFTVFLGTVFPLLVEAIKGTKISVGEPYFNAMTVPVGLVMVFLMGVGPSLPWGQPKLDVLVWRFALPASLGVATGFVCALFGLREPMALLTFSLCGFAAAVTLREMFAPAFTRAKERGESFWRALPRTLSGNRRRVGGYIVHLGVLMIVVSIAGSNTYRYSVEASLTPGQSFVVGNYELTYKETAALQQSHRFSVQAVMEVKKDGELLATMRPALNHYPSQREPIATPEVKTIGQEDLYLSLLSAAPDGSKAGIKAYVIPMVPWMWWAIPVLVGGSLFSLWPRKKRRASLPAGAATEST